MAYSPACPRLSAGQFSEGNSGASGPHTKVCGQWRAPGCLTDPLVLSQRLWHRWPALRTKEALTGRLAQRHAWIVSAAPLSRFPPGIHGAGEQRPLSSGVGSAVGRQPLTERKPLYWTQGKEEEGSGHGKSRGRQQKWRVWWPCDSWEAGPCGWRVGD